MRKEHFRNHLIVAIFANQTCRQSAVGQSVQVAHASQWSHSFGRHLNRQFRDPCQYVIHGQQVHHLAWKADCEQKRFASRQEIVAQILPRAARVLFDTTKKHVGYR